MRTTRASFIVWCAITLLMPVLLFVLPGYTHAQQQTTPAILNTDPGVLAYWREYNKHRTDILALGSTASAHLPIPVLLGKEVVDLVPNFGDSRDNGLRIHEGLDIHVPFGTPIVSPTSAVVLAVGYDTDTGIFVFTTNPGYEHFRYLHLREVAKGIGLGTVLKRGDVIGYVGNTGNASTSPPHLHFEIRKDGPHDPLPRLTTVFTLEERMRGVQQALERTTSSTELAAELYRNFSYTFDEARAKGIAIAQPIAALMPVVQVAEAAQTMSALPVVSSPATGHYSRDLQSGMKGEDVRALQKYLNANGYLVSNIGDGAPGYETLVFGALTRKALITFQSAKGITPAAGYFGPKTRAYVNTNK